MSGTVAMEKPKKIGKYDKWEVENAARTITDAHKHMANPAMMKEVTKILAKDKKALDSIMSKIPEMDDSDGDEDDKIDSIEKLKKVRNKKFQE